MSVAPTVDKQFQLVSQEIPCLICGKLDVDSALGADNGQALALLISAAGSHEAHRVSPRTNLGNVIYLETHVLLREGKYGSLEGLHLNATGALEEHDV